MNYVCAWCSKPLCVSAGKAAAGEGTSHGICDECALTFVGIRRLQVAEILKRVSAPVLVMASGLRVVGANPAAGVVFGKKPEAIEGQLQGEVLDCVGACSPGGCGKSAICPACVLRQTVEATSRDGVSRHGLLSRHRVRHGNLESGLQFRFSTAKAGDTVVVNLDHPVAAQAASMAPAPAETRGSC